MLLTQTSHSVLTIQWHPGVTVTQEMLLTQTSHSLLTIQRYPRVTVTQEMLLTQTSHSVLTIQTEAPHINIESFPLSIFMLFFFELTQLLVEDRYILSLVLGHTGQRTVCTAWHDCSRNVLVFATIVQMRHDQRDTIKDYWSKLDQYSMALYSNTETDCIVCWEF
jgi:hypothetical protein